MSKPYRFRGGFLFYLVAAYFLATTANAGSLDLKADSELGRSIFQQGIGRDGRNINTLNQYGIDVAIACSGCHGENGSGGGESFVRAPDIRWINLTKPYGARNNGTQAVPYTFDSFSKAIRTGTSSQGRKLDPIMPRVQLANDEIESLMAYLQVLSKPDKKNTSRSTVFGLLPRAGKNPIADMLAEKLSHCDSESHKRTAAIEIIRFDEPDDAIQKMNTRMANLQNVVVLIPFLFGWETQYAEFSSAANIQTVLPITLLDMPASENWHYSFPGLLSQIARLLEFAAQDGKSSVLIHYDKNSSLSEYLYQQSIVLLKIYSLVHIKDRKQSSAGNHAELWLTTIPHEVINSLVGAEQLTLIPASFTPFSFNKKIDSTSKNIRIAHPYIPKNDGQWQSPIKIWSEAACEFLNKFDLTQPIKNQLDSITLKKSGTTMPAQETLTDRKQSVIITNENGDLFNLFLTPTPVIK